MVNIKDLINKIKKYISRNNTEKKPSKPKDRLDVHNEKVKRCQNCNGKIIEKVEEIVEEKNPFYYEYKNFTLTINNEKEFDEYVQKIFDLSALEKVIENDTSKVAPSIKQFIAKIRKNKIVEFDEDEDQEENTDKIIDYLDKYVINPSFQNIIKGMYLKFDDSPSYENILSTLNNYLINLGVYAKCVKVGDEVKNLVSFYDFIGANSSASLDQSVKEIYCPAYILDYCYDDDETRSLIRKGSCCCE